MSFVGFKFIYAWIFEYVNWIVGIEEMNSALIEGWAVVENKTSFLLLRSQLVIHGLNTSPIPTTLEKTN